MAKNKENGVYRIVDVVGVSTVSWEDSAKRAVETAARSIRDLRIAEVTKMDITVKNERCRRSDQGRSFFQIRKVAVRPSS